MYDSEPRRSRRGISFGPILIIILGIVFLLNNFGVLPWEIWQNIWKFWPVLLVLFGIEVLLGRTSSLRTIIFLLVLIFLLPVLLILNPLTGNPLANETLTIDKPLGTLTKAEVNFELPSNNLKLVALEGGSDRVLVSTVKYSKLLPEPEILEDRKFDEVLYTFRQPSTYIPFSANLGNTVDLKLSRLIPNHLFIKSTTGVFDLNFQDLNIPELEIETGSAQITISYSATSSNRTFMKSAATKVILKIPNGLAARIKTDSVVKEVKIDEKKFKKQDNTYTTVNFEGSTVKAEIEITGSAASVEVQ